MPSMHDVLSGGVGRGASSRRRADGQPTSGRLPFVRGQHDLVVRGQHDLVVRGDIDVGAVDTPGGTSEQQRSQTRAPAVRQPPARPGPPKGVLSTGSESSRASPCQSNQ